LLSCLILLNRDQKCRAKPGIFIIYWVRLVIRELDQHHSLNIFQWLMTQVP